MVASRPPDRRTSVQAWTETFYSELRDIAQRAFADERRGHTLQPTAVVHEVCLRLLRGKGLPDLPRTEQMALAARVMEQVLIDHHRVRSAEKRGGGRLRLELEDQFKTDEPTTDVFDLDAVHRALARLQHLDPRQADVVRLKIFGGMDMAAIAEELATSKRTVEAAWTVAKAWLRRELSEAFGAGA